MLILKISKVTLIGLVLLIALACVGAVNACTEGCTPGYWKNHYPEAWPISNGYLWFGGGYIDLNGDGNHDTLLDALNYNGGSGVNGAKRIFLRAWAAGVLNYYSPEIDYDTYIFGITGNILSRGDRQELIYYAGILDGYNNLGCPY